MRKCNQAMGIILLLLSLFVIFGSRELEYTREFTPGAGFLPFWLGISLAILSIVLLIKNTILKSNKSEDNPLPRKQAFLRIIIIFGSLFAGVLLLERLGFLLVMTLFTACLLIFLENFRWYKGALISVVMVSAVYGIFKIWLNIPLPSGLLPL
jgi:putative tricarboxylic transport membrane protein